MTTSLQFAVIHTADDAFACTTCTCMVTWQCCKTLFVYPCTYILFLLLWDSRESYYYNEKLFSLPLWEVNAWGLCSYKFAGSSRYNLFSYSTCILSTLIFCTRVHTLHTYYYTIYLVFSATDVTNISQSLQVDSIDLQGGSGVIITVSFKVHTHAHNYTYMRARTHTRTYHGFPKKENRVIILSSVVQGKRLRVHSEFCPG